MELFGTGTGISDQNKTTTRRKPGGLVGWVFRSRPYPRRRQGCHRSPPFAFSRANVRRASGHRGGHNPSPIRRGGLSPAGAHRKKKEKGREGRVGCGVLPSKEPRLVTCLGGGRAGVEGRRPAQGSCRSPFALVGSIPHNTPLSRVHRRRNGQKRANLWAKGSAAAIAKARTAGGGTHALRAPLLLDIELLGPLVINEDGVEGCGVVRSVCRSGLVGNSTPPLMIRSSSLPWPLRTYNTE